MPSNAEPFCLAQARVDVAANIDDARIRPQSQDLHFATAGRGANHWMGREQIQRRAMSGDQYVSGVVAIRIGHDRYRGMDDRWQVLRGVDRGIDLAAQNRGFNRIGEDTPAANLGQG